MGIFFTRFRKIMTIVTLGEDVSSILFLGKKRHARDNVTSLTVITAPIIPIFACNRNGEKKKRIHRMHHSF